MTRRAPFTTEAELAKVVVAWLSNLGWEVFQEVQANQYCPIADIVGRKGTLTCVVETKLSLGLRVLNQADYWRTRANLVYVAVPQYGQGRDVSFAVRVAELLGIGVLRANPEAYSGVSNITEVKRPAFRRNIYSELAKSLNDGHKTFAEAGNADGRRWTPFQQTCDTVRRYAQVHPGAPLKEIIDNVKTHYSTPATARTSLAKWIEGGHVAGLRVERIGRSLRVFPVETN
jgi:hypothetical protein